MPPPVGRYGPGPFPHLQQAQLQQQQQHQPQQQQSQPHQPQPQQQHNAAAHVQTPGAAAGLPPPSLAGHPGFGPGSSANPNLNPFAIPGMNGVGSVSGFPGATGIGAGVGVGGGAGGAGAAGSNGSGGIPDGGGTGLASHAAQMGFVRGAQMQQQQQAQQSQQSQQQHAQPSQQPTQQGNPGHPGQDGRLPTDGKGSGVKSRIRDVWKHNLAQEMQALRALVEKYPYISMVCCLLCCVNMLLLLMYVRLTQLNGCRTQSFPVSWHGRWVRSRPRQTTIIRRSGAMSTSSR